MPFLHYGQDCNGTAKRAGSSHSSGLPPEPAFRYCDVVLVRSNPLDVVSIVELARRTYAKMVQNLAWATGYNVVAIPLAAGALYGAGVLLSPAAGAVLMSLSTVIVAVNAKRLTF